jgi:FtsP/CotA-like multicopper oxidase with cupredoxin domain
MSAPARPALALLLSASCSVTPPPAGPPPGQPTGWNAEVALPEARDRNPDPRVVEIDLAAQVAPVELKAGVTTDAWTYGGRVPGPLIRLHRGDRLIVHFANQLPEETTIHWHGLRIPVAMDGVPEHSQPPVAPGASFTYDFVVPDAGLFWYHPHFHSAGQLGDGLYGAIVVEDDAEPRGFGDELVMMLSDASIEPDGHLHPPDSGGDTATLFGREGNVLLINGRQRPTIVARPGVPQRWRLVNSARSRYYKLALEGHTFVRIGGDGGLLPAPVERDRLVIIPGERADVVFVPRGQPGTSLPLRWVPAERGYGSTFARSEEVIATIRFEGAPVTPPPLPPTGRTIEPLSTDGATAVDIKLTQDKIDGHYYLGINDHPFTETVAARLGETQVWNLTNAIDFAHPFHLHGFFFQVLDGHGRPVEPIEWKDTADVPASGKAQIAVRYQDRPGMWMFHCHILDHADAGMMGMLDLQP